MKSIKRFLIFCTLCLVCSVFGFAACGDNFDPSVIPVVSINLDRTELELEVGETYDLNATVLPSNATDGTKVWKSSHKSVATVEDGKVKAVARGVAKITVTAGGKSADCVITVNEKSVVPVANISLNKVTLVLTEGEAFTLIATVLPANATNRTVSWVSDSACVSVTDKGAVRAEREGTAVITATADGKKAVCAVTVNKRTEVTLDAETAELTVGDTITLTATVIPAATQLIWQSSDETVVTVEDGVITAKSAGVAYVTVTAGGASATCTVTVSANFIPVTGITLNKSATTLTVGFSEVLTAFVTPADATDVTVKWTSSDESVATVTNGVVLAKTTGRVQITATAGGMTAICVVTVVSAENT